MTTLRERRAELAAALEAAGIRTTDDANGTALPFALLFGQGIDTRHLARGQVPASTRIVLCAGVWDGKGTSATLAGLVETALATLRGLAGWQVGEISPDRTATAAGGLVLVASITATAMIDV